MLERPSGNAVVEAFLKATNKFGVPFEVLTDNGKQFIGRFPRPLPVEVLLERTCRELGITGEADETEITHHHRQGGAVWA